MNIEFERYDYASNGIDSFSINADFSASIEVFTDVRSISDVHTIEFNTARDQVVEFLNELKRVEDSILKSPELEDSYPTLILIEQSETNDYISIDVSEHHDMEKSRLAT